MSTNQPAVDDDDLGTIFRLHRERQQQKRADNREFSTGMLREAGVFFTSHNDGAHLIVAERWDFWPGTGRFTERKGRAGQRKREGRGVRRLLAIIKEDADGNAV